MQLSAQLECQRHIAIVTQWSARTYATHGSLTADDGQRVGNHWRSALLRVSVSVYVCLLCIMAVSWTWHIFQSPMLADRPNQPNKGGEDIGIKIERETLIHKQSTQIRCHWLWTRKKSRENNFFSIHFAHRWSTRVYSLCRHLYFIILYFHSHLCHHHHHA